MMKVFVFPQPDSQVRPNRRELAALPEDIQTVWGYLKREFPDVDPTPERRAVIEAMVNVHRAAHAYATFTAMVDHVRSGK